MAVATEGYFRAFAGAARQLQSDISALSLMCSNAAMRAAIAKVLLFFVFAIGPVRADDLVIPLATYPALPRHGSSAEAFVPQNWRIETKLPGDLNGDGRPDLVLVLRGNDARNVLDARGQGGPEKFDTNPRIIAIAFADAAGGYDLVLENHTLVARTTYPGEQDPLDPNGVQEGGLEIKNGTLRVTLGYFGGNMGRNTFTFRFDKTDFRLIGFDSIDVERSSGKMNEVSINYLTRRMKHSTAHISDDKDKVTWKTLPVKPLLTMDRIADGIMFQPPK